MYQFFAGVWSGAMITFIFTCKPLGHKEVEDLVKYDPGERGHSSGVHARCILVHTSRPIGQADDDVEKADHGMGPCNH